MIGVTASDRGHRLRITQKRRRALLTVMFRGLMYLQALLGF